MRGKSGFGWALGKELLIESFEHYAWREQVWLDIREGIVDRKREVVGGSIICMVGECDSSTSSLK